MGSKESNQTKQNKSIQTFTKSALNETIYILLFGDQYMHIPNFQSDKWTDRHQTES